MIVREMIDPQKKIITVEPHQTVTEAIKLMNKNGIRHLPVVDGDGFLIGILSDRDLRDASPSVLESHKSAQDHVLGDIMTTNVITGTPDDFIEDIAALFHEFRISCLPILSEGKLFGIITNSDLLKIFIHITGASEPSSHIELMLDDHKTSLCGALRILESMHIGFSNVLMYKGLRQDCRRLVIRSNTMKIDALTKKLREEGYHVLWPQGKT